MMNWKKEVKTTFPSGTYQVKIIKWERSESSVKKTPQLNITAEVISPKDYEGGNIIEYIPVSEKSLWRVAKFISCCGVNVSKLSNMDVSSKDFDIVLNECVGKKTFWSVADKTNEDGKSFNDVTDYLHDPQQEITEPKFDAKWE